MHDINVGKLSQSFQGIIRRTIVDNNYLKRQTRIAAENRKKALPRKFPFIKDGNDY